MMLQLCRKPAWIIPCWVIVLTQFSAVAMRHAYLFAQHDYGGGLSLSGMASWVVALQEAIP